MTSIFIYIFASLYLGFQGVSVKTNSVKQKIDLPTATKMSEDLHIDISRFMFEAKCKVEYELHSGGVALCAQNELLGVTGKSHLPNAIQLSILVQRSVEQKQQQGQDELRRKFEEAKNILKSIELVDLKKSVGASEKVRDSAFLLLHVFENAKRFQ